MAVKTDSELVSEAMEKLREGTEHIGNALINFAEAGSLLAVMLARKRIQEAEKK